MLIWIWSELGTASPSLLCCWLKTKLFYSLRYTSRKESPILKMSEQNLTDYQIHNEVQHGNVDHQKNVQETKFLNRFTPFHQSFVGRKPLNRASKTRHSLYESHSRTYQTRANYSRGKPRTEPLLRSSSNNNGEQRNQANVRKVFMII